MPAAQMVCKTSGVIETGSMCSVAWWVLITGVCFFFKSPIIILIAGLFSTSKAEGEVNPQQAILVKTSFLMWSGVSNYMKGFCIPLGPLEKYIVLHSNQNVHVNAFNHPIWESSLRQTSIITRCIHPPLINTGQIGL